MVVMARTRHLFGMLSVVAMAALAFALPPTPSPSPLSARIESLYAQRLQGVNSPDQAQQIEKIFQQNGLPTNAAVGEDAATDYIVLLADTPADFIGQILPAVRGAADAGTIWPDAYLFLHAQLARKDMLQMASIQKPGAPELGVAIHQLVQLDQLAYSRADADPKQVAVLEGQVRFGIQNILQQYGMPTYTMVGVPATQEFFGLMKHQPDRLLHTVLPALQQVLDRGEGDPQTFAVLFDRIRTNQGDPQTYGTQIVCSKEGQRIPWKIGSEKHLDHRRAALGLEPERCYLDKELRHPQPCTIAQKR